ncbi:MAG: MbnP family protein, partial [Woeseiaceae bacterium]
MTPGRGVWLLAVFCVTACAPPQDTFTIPFEAWLAGAPADCASDRVGPAMSDLRFYVSDVRLHNVDGTETPLQLVENGRWQQSDIALIDLEDGTGRGENGTPD